MEDKNLETQTPQTGTEKTANQEGEKTTQKTTEELQKEISTLHAQKEHFREKFEKASSEITDWQNKYNSVVNTPSDDYMTDGEKAIFERQKLLEKEISDIKAEKELNKKFYEAISEYPDLKKDEQGFMAYLLENPSTNIKILAESYLFSQKPKKKGLETPTAGSKAEG